MPLQFVDHCCSGFPVNVCFIIIILFSEAQLQQMFGMLFYWVFWHLMSFYSTRVKCGWNWKDIAKIKITFY